jgi:hypothetical protein
MEMPLLSSITKTGGSEGVKTCMKIDFLGAVGVIAHNFDSGVHFRRDSMENPMMPKVVKVPNRKER